ncbi:MAG: UDP-N-acetylmuramoyl-L-alanine--D-glutamate ligase [Oscillospiraceae bacterium]|nr:UDP-N-acetylmuramoyl-L-alanine--D-glutamate ligase [Oscillospiraceae bacterium]
MEYFRALKGKRVGVIGLGISNRPLVELLVSYGIQVSVYDRDERIDRSPWEALGVSLTLGGDYLDRLEGDVVFRTPSLRPDDPALERVRAAGGAVTSEMNVFLALCPATVLGVTGSDGKTTTAALMAEMLKEETAGYHRRVYLGGNIGSPLLARVPEMTEADFAVVELSSFQLMDMTHSPHVAVITNLTPNHLDWHKDMDEYIAAKRRILNYQQAGDIAVLNRGDAVTAALRVRGQRREFGLSSGDGGSLGACLPPEDILLPGRHNAENVMAAIAATSDWVRLETAVHVARTFRGVAHRNQFVREVDGVAFYNDSIGSTPTRTIASLSAHKQPVVLICGGYDKNLSYEPLARELHRAKAVVLMGATARKIREAAEPQANRPPMYDAADMADAVTKAYALAMKGDVVMLSPASASFDMYRNFEERGDAFNRQVLALT